MTTIRSALDDVVVRDDVALGANDEPGANAAAGRGLATCVRGRHLGHDVHHGGADVLEEVRDGRALNNLVGRGLAG